MRWTLSRYMFTILILSVLAASPAFPQAAGPDSTAVVVFSRHTFRGVTQSIGPHRIQLPQFGLDFPLPLLSYGMEATPHGLAMTRQFASPALNQAAAKAVEGLGSGRRFDDRWDEIRIDLATSRNFFTALYLRDGLQGGQKTPIALTGCPTVEGQGVDAVSKTEPVRKCVPPAELHKLQANSPVLERLRLAGEDLLRLVGTATGKGGTFKLELAEPTHPAYVQLGGLAGAIEMTAEQGPPLGLLFPQAPRESVRRYEPDAVRRASGFVGVRFAALFPREMACACSVLPVEYINSTPAGRHVIVQAHDDVISALCRSLGTISDTGDIDDLATYPLESVIFALGDQRVSIVRMRMQIGEDGSFPGPFESRILWQGSRSEWDQKVQNVVEQARAWKAGTAARAELRILPAQPLDVLCPH